MDLTKLKDKFPSDDIEWRIGSSGIKKDGNIWATCLAYISARAIMNRLDEVCGAENWTPKYTQVSSTGVMCHLAIKICDQWVTKEDGAEHTDFEPFKGGISSALKRAGSVWGIGRYLYELDAGFAEVSPTKQPKMSYAKTKDGKEFYWAPPLLPEWALPPGGKPKESPPQTTSELYFDDYRIPFRGRNENCLLREVPINELKQSIAYWENKAPLTGKPLEFVRVAKAYIASFGQTTADKLATLDEREPE